MKKPFVIGVTGCSGSGKTLFIKQVIEEFRDDRVCLISQDNYYRPRDKQPVDVNGIKNFDLPESFDMDRFVADVRKITGGENIRIREYTYNNPSIRGKDIEFKPAPVIILEGIFIFYIEEIRILFDLSIFVHAMEHIMISRRILRDNEERGYDLDDVLYRYRHHVMPAFNKYILPFRESCDIVVNNNESFHGALPLITARIREVLAPEN